MATTNIQVALDEAGKVVKRQHTTAGKVSTCIDQLMELVRKSQEELASEDCLDPDVVTSALQKQVDDLGMLKDMQNQTKELHAAISKLSKAMEKAFDSNADVCKALRGVPMDQPTLYQVLTEHYCREGRFDIADVLADEAGVMGVDELKTPYLAMHAVLTQIRAHDLQPALEWAVAHRPQLSSGGQPSKFEFRLHSLAYIHQLTTTGRDAALRYAKAHFEPFKSRHMKEIQRLMGCLLFAHRTSITTHSSNGSNALPSVAGAPTPLSATGSAAAHSNGLGGGAGSGGSVTAIGGSSNNGLVAGSSAHSNGGPVAVAVHPYADLLSPRGWDDAAAEFTKQACGLMGQAYESPLTVAVAAGSVALPALLKLAGVMDRNAQDLASCEQLPVELELGPEFVFHSIFACPVSKEASTAENPPVLLPCGHVLCEQSVLKIAKGRTRPFKCPYCPMEARAEGLLRLVFPDAE